MADKYVQDFFERIVTLQMPSHNRIGFPLYDHVPFTEKEEFIMSLTVRQAQKQGTKITPQDFKTFALDFANKLGLLWDVDNHYEEWYKGFCSRNPWAYTCLHPETDPVELNKQYILENWDENRKTRLPSVTLAANDEVDNLILDVNEHNSLIFRYEEQEDVVTEFYGNWLFNTRGYPEAIIIGFTQDDVNAQSAKIIKNVLSKIQYKTPGGCSFNQELLNGLRMHSHHAFPIGITSTAQSAEPHVRPILRRLFQARCAKADMPYVKIPSTTENLIIAKVKETFSKFDSIPFNPMPMVTHDIICNILFQSTEDNSIQYTYTNLYELYVNTCKLYTFQPHGQNGSIFNLNVFPKYKTKYILFGEDGANRKHVTITTGIEVKAQHKTPSGSLQHALKRKLPNLLFV